MPRHIFPYHHLWGFAADHYTLKSESTSLSLEGKCPKQEILYLSPYRCLFVSPTWVTACLKRWWDLIRKTYEVTGSWFFALPSLLISLLGHHRWQLGHLHFLLLRVVLDLSSLRNHDRSYNQFHFHSAQCQSVLTIAKTFTLQPKGKWHNTLSSWYICNDFIWRITPDTRDYFQCIYKTFMLAFRAETWRRWAVCCIFKQPFIYSSNRDPLYI